MAGRIVILCVVISLCVFLTSAFGAQARNPSPTEKLLSELMKLPAKDRTDRLVEGARREGVLVFYSPEREDFTQMRIDFLKELYPGVIKKFETPRVRSDTLIDRVLTEERAGRHQVDVIRDRFFNGAIMLREELLARYVALADMHLPADFKDPKGAWRSTGNRLFHIMYNSKLVSEKEAPKTWEDLLDSKWKGKLILDAAAYDWFIGMLDYMGENKGLEFMKRLARNGLQIQQRRSNVENVVAAGEVPIMVANSGTSAAERMDQGEPVAFVKDPRPPIAYGEITCIMRNAPHPHAAALFVEVLLSEKAQREVAKKIRVRSVLPNIPDPLIDPAVKPHFVQLPKWPPERYEWAQREYVRILVRKDF